MKTDISVIVVNWNGRRFLPRCLEALARQTANSLEVIVVDNASTDGSAEWIRTHHPEVKLLAMPHNLGFAAANNLAAQRASGHWLALLNPDAFPEPDWLAALHAASRAFPEASSFAGKLLMAEHPERLDGTGDVYHVSGLAWRRDHDRSDASASRGGGWVFSPCGASALYRRDRFLELGGFDEDFFCYLEDIDLGFRMQLLGDRCRYVPDAVARHLGSASTGQRSAFSSYQGQRNLVWVYCKNMPGPLFWTYLPLHVVMNLFSVAWLALRGQGRVALAAKRDALKHLRTMWRKRRAIQQNRRVGCWRLRRSLARGLSVVRR
jgi:GT2 family glycosyltransferase